MFETSKKQQPVEKTADLRVVLAGNPNSGKTSIFNALTGAHQRVGNYAGVTVEKRQGHYLADGKRVQVLDLPGTYSLTSYSPEERIAQDELLQSKPDVVVAVVDSTALKRSLVLLVQLMQTGANPVLCLNMADEAERAGLRLDLALLQQLLGFEVIQTVGHRGIGVQQLKASIQRAASSPVQQNRLVLGERLTRALEQITAILEQIPQLDPASHSWVATKLLLNDPTFVEWVRQTGDSGQRAVDEASRLRSSIESETRVDIAVYVMERYYGFVDGMLREVTLQPQRSDARALSDLIDSILAHRLLGLPFFLLAMYAIFWITFTLGEIPMGWIEQGFSALGGWIKSFWPQQSDSLLRSLLVDGIIGGVGGVVAFLPNIVLLFFCLAFLEDTGYMARAAFLMDHVMHRFGLHGKSFIPLMTGFGCSIPGIMATRTLEQEKDRLATMLVLPLISCGARLTIWMLLIPAFFAPRFRAPVLWSLYMAGILLALALALLLRKSLLKSEDAPFVMELPPYRLPTLRAALMKMSERSWLYLRKAGTIILAISVLMWCITTFPRTDSFQIDAQIAAGAEVLTDAEVESRRAAESMRNSIAGQLGRALEPLLAPLGFDWKIGTALIGAFAAKEVFVAQLGIIYSLGGGDEGSQGLRETLGQQYPPLVGLSLMLFLLIGTPCMATLAITRRESGGWRWALLQFGGLTLIAYLVSLVFYQVGRLVV